MDVIGINMDNIKDSKLTTKKRKALPASVFCGPSRSFPCHDCSHIKAALSLLGRYKGKGSKEAIRKCIYAKAKKLKCFKSDKQNKTLDEVWIEYESLLENIKLNYDNNLLTIYDIHEELFYIIDMASLDDSIIVKITELLFSKTFQIDEVINYIREKLNN